MKSDQVFDAVCARVGPKLMNEFGWRDFQAAGCLGNLGYECSGFTKLREEGFEDEPTHGGYGWAQWTGPRRVKFLAYCEHQGLDWHSEDANYGYLVKELRNEYAHTVASVAKARSVEDATIRFENSYESAGIKAMGSRKSWALKALRSIEV